MSEVEIKNVVLCTHYKVICNRTVYTRYSWDDWELDGREVEVIACEPLEAAFRKHMKENRTYVND